MGICFFAEKRELHMKKKIKLYEEFIYIIAILLLSLGVAMTAASNFGVSMIVAPAYIISLKFSFLTFGQAGYLVQAMLFIIYLIIVRKVKPSYLFFVVTCVLYGVILDSWRSIIPILNPHIVAPGDFSMWLRILLYIAGAIISSFSVALFFKVYLYPQVYDFFVKKVSEKFKTPVVKFKLGYDIVSLFLAHALSLMFFGRVIGIGWGTFIMAISSGYVTGIFLRILDRYFVFEPKFRKISKHF